MPFLMTNLKYKHDFYKRYESDCGIAKIFHRSELPQEVGGILMKLLIYATDEIRAGYAYEQGKEYIYYYINYMGTVKKNSTPICCQIGY